MRTLYTFKHRVPSLGESIETYAIKRPTRLELDEVEMARSRFFSECVNNGILTKEMLQKTYKEFGGPLAKEEQEQYNQVLEVFMESGLKAAQAKSKKTKDKHLQKRMEAFTALQEIEQKHEELYARTADFIAQNKTLMFLFLMLSLRQETDGSFSPFFDQESYQERYEAFSKMEEESPEDAAALLEHFTFLISFWYYGGVTDVSEEEFSQYEVLSDYKVFDELDGKEDTVESGSDSSE